MLEAIQEKSRGRRMPQPLRLGEAKRTQTMKQKITSLAEAFHVQTYSYLDDVYLDALCLTGSRDTAADLVVKTYVRAFEDYEGFRRHRLTPPQRTESTLTWLYRHMHACFCDEILQRAKQAESEQGGRI